MYRAHDELPLMQQWPRGRADDRVTLPTDLETSQLTLRAVEPRRLRNDFEDFFCTRRSQLICSAEIALPILMSWYLLVVDKPADARSRSDKSTEQILAETTRPCPRSTNSAASASMTGPVPRTTPRSASVEPRPRIRRFWRSWRSRYAPIGLNKRMTRSQRWTLIRRRYLSASAWHSPHVLKAMRSCFRLKMQMCRCVGSASYSSSTTVRRGFVPLRRSRSLV